MKVNDFVSESGRVSSTKTTQDWVSKNFPEEYKMVKENSFKIGLTNCTFSEELYHYFMREESVIVCKKCKISKTKFSGLLLGYRQYCSSKCSNNSREVQNKKEKAYLEKYGVSNPSKSKKIIDKIQETFRTKYGDNPFKIEGFKKKIKETNIKKYGTESPMSNRSSLREKINEKTLDQFLKKYEDLDIFDFDPKKGGSAKIRCKKCLEIFEISKWNLHQRTKSKLEITPCTICNPIGINQKSQLQNFVRKILEESGLPFEEGERKILEGKEMDFFIPAQKIGIEVNGIFWHSERFKDVNYHLDKTNLAVEKGVHLIQIFEDEILEKPDQVKSRINSIIGLNQRKIFARKCKIKEVGKKESLKFLEENHIQGMLGSGKRIGLFLGDELVSLMTFGGLRKNLGSKPKENVWELLRFCNLSGTNVLGGASKILKYFIKTYQPKGIISYCDRRWSNGNFYKKLGFTLDGVTKPNYYYVIKQKRENRFKYRKDVLIKDGFDPSKSEASIMMDRGFYRIYDCGNFRFLL